MKLLAFGLLSLCLHAWSSVVTSPLGDTVSLNCLYSTNSSSDDSSMFWYRQLPGRRLEPILQSFSPDDTFSYSYLRAGEHFTVEKNHTLVIRNVTREDAATYYCSKLEKDVCRFGDGIELRVDGTMKVNVNHQGTMKVNVNHQVYCSSGILIWASTILGFLLVVMTSALTYVVCRLKSKVRQQESVKNTRRHCLELEIPPTKEDLEGEYQSLSHKDQALYEVCGRSKEQAGNEE
ncbi:uncharacterized protein LOC120516298 [Polypterus senegalus]|uniref:uncharacterized protein LOC120516298 n=1 Tax=Polypterus senegalus TaxID=55291 RepID=UPI001965B110|nr:uncharacterized protein LOC120516298 [Polypterus senegalus]